MKTITSVRGLGKVFYIRTLCLALICVLFGRASGALLSYEGFDYAGGSSVIGQSGGSGFANAWQAGGTPNTAPNFGAAALAGSLQYKDAFGNSLVTAGGKGLFTGQFGTSQTTRDLSGAVGADGTTIWMSFLGQRQGPTVTATNPYPRGGALRFFNVGAERISVGTASGTAAGNWSLTPTGTAANGRPSATPLSELTFMLVRVDSVAGNDTAYLWTNPRLGVEPSIGTAAATLTGLDFQVFTRISPFAGNTDTANNRPYAELYLDEIRIGNSFADVTPFVPVPEPSVVVLCVVGLAIFALRSKRRFA